MESHEKRIEAEYLSKCSPQAAYDWLYDRRIKDVYERCESCDPTLEYLLLRRKDALIDLAIAKFGHSEAALKTVFYRGSVGTRCAALSNPHIGSTFCNYIVVGYGNSIVFSAIEGTKAEQESLIKNSNLKVDLIENLLNRDGLFKGKTDDEYIQLLVWLGGNPRIKKTYEETGLRFDGSASYFHDRIFYMAWKLAEKLPTTQEFAWSLYVLLSNTKTVSATTFEDFPSVMERWRIEDDVKSGEPSLSASYWLRTRLADLVWPDHKLADSEDFAERDSFYRRCDSSYEWSFFIEKDGVNAFNSFVYNDNLWKNEKNRKLLRDIAWDKNLNTDLDAINKFIEVEKYYRKNHPKWFLEEDLKWSDSNEAIVSRLEKDLQKLCQACDSMRNNSENLNSLVSVNFDRLLEGIKEIKNINSYSGDAISDSLKKFSTELESLQFRIMEYVSSNQQANDSSRPAPLWPWYIVIFILIIILMK